MRRETLASLASRVGAHVRRYRIQFGYTPEQMARWLEVRTNTLKQWEAGLKAPSMEQLVWIANFTTTPVAELLAESLEVGDPDVEAKALLMMGEGLAMLQLLRRNRGKQA